MARKNNQSGQLRIIGGQWRSRRLPICSLEGLRPTTDRVRETLFNWLAPYLPGARVLDCFAGSGALGLEALSRYADFAQLCELQTSAAKQLNANLATLKCDTAKVVQTDTLKLLSTPPTQAFDIVFIDPPFNQDMVNKTLFLLDKHKWLKQDALIYVETETQHGQLDIPECWVPLKEKKAGQVNYRLYQYQTPNDTVESDISDGDAL